MKELNRNIHDFFYTLLALPRAWRLIRYYKLWDGLKEYKWVFRFLIVVAGLAGLYLILEYDNWSDDHSNDGFMSFFVGSDSLISTIGSDTYESITDGALKWIILILLEVVIYHFMRPYVQTFSRGAEAYDHGFICRLRHRSSLCGRPV
jgi:hypothetical protein